MRRIAIVASAAVLALLGGGCSGDEPEDREEQAATGTAEAAAGEADDAPTTGGSTEQVKELGGEMVAFGAEASYDDGLTVEVSAPKPFEPSKGTPTADGEEHVKVTVRVVNGSRKELPLSAFSVMVESRDGQGGDVIDAAQRMAGTPARAVKPGGRAQWVQGFGVRDPDDVLVVVQPGMERAPVAFRAS